MANKAGVWIDHKQAIVILVSDAGTEIKKIPFGIGQPVRSTGGAKSKHSYSPNDFVAEDRMERKVENDRKDYFDEVIAFVRGAEALLILGPGEAKGEFFKRIKSRKLFENVVELETTDKMTDRQLAAKVREHFAKDTVSKSVVSNGKAKSGSAKRTTKPGK